MKELLRKTALMSGLVIISLAAVFFLPGDHSSYLTADLDKRELLRVTPSPRVIFVGGANVAFGVNGQLVKKTTGRASVNMGLHGNVGLRYMINEVAPRLGRGDTVVILPEYEQFFGMLDGAGGISMGMISADLRTAAYFEPRRLAYDIATNLPRLFETKVRGVRYALAAWLFNIRLDKPIPVYYRAGFNGNGDFVNHIGVEAPVPDFSKSPPIKGRLDEAAVVFLNDFSVQAENAGARVYFSYPTFARTSFKQNSAKVAALKKYLAAQLRPGILNEPGDLVFKDSCYFDTPYHLTGECRDAFNERLLSALEKAEAASR